MGKYIKIELIEQKKKTGVYSVMQSDRLFILGFIKWFPAWRKYCFFPEEDIIFDVMCLKTIIAFIENLMEERDIERAKKKNI